MTMPLKTAGRSFSVFRCLIWLPNGGHLIIQAFVAEIEENGKENRDNPRKATSCQYSYF